MCSPGERTMVHVHVHPSIASEGREVYKPMPIDSCIADLVQRLDDAGLRMLASCCGHGENWGQIALVDGRTIWIESPTCEACGRGIAAGEDSLRLYPSRRHETCPAALAETEETDHG